MKNQERTALAAALALVAACLPGPGTAEEIFRQTQGVNCLPNGGACAQFQGYIYVRRENQATPEPSLRPAGAGDSQLGERRLYLHLGSAEPR
jgi:hypothetical protein